MRLKIVMVGRTYLLMRYVNKRQESYAFHIANNTVSILRRNSLVYAGHFKFRGSRAVIPNNE